MHLDLKRRRKKNRTSAENNNFRTVSTHLSIELCLYTYIYKDILRHDKALTKLFYKIEPWGYHNSTYNVLIINMIAGHLEITMIVRVMGEFRDYS